jgi:hypothetical protein
MDGKPDDFIKHYFALRMQQIGRMQYRKPVMA